MKISQLLAAPLLVTCAACAVAPPGVISVRTADELQSIQQQYAPFLSTLSVGMPLSDFQKSAKDVYPVGQKGFITAYELSSVQKYVTQADMDRQNNVVGFGSPNPRTRKQVLWFYFVDGKLLSWGEPNQWPN